MRLILFIIITSTLFAFDIKPLPQSVSYDKPKARLGEKLFFDPKLSKDGTVACVNCHNIYTNGADSTEVSTGVDGQQGIINSPTVFNSVFNMSQFFDGRASTLQEQVKFPLTNPIEMGNTIENVLAYLRSDPTYYKTFKNLYGAVSATSLYDAIAEYEKKLITPNAKFDQYLLGKTTLSKKEALGYRYFREYGCISCHNGVNVGSNSYQRFGIFKPLETKDIKHSQGRYNVTHNEEDRLTFKVPTLRNIAKTAPYFHTGSAATLSEAIKEMGLHQLGLHLTPSEIEAIEAFLETLSAPVLELEHAD